MPLWTFKDGQASLENVFSTFRFATLGLLAMLSKLTTLTATPTLVLKRSSILAIPTWVAGVSSALPLSPLVRLAQSSYLGWNLSPIARVHDRVRGLSAQRYLQKWRSLLSTTLARFIVQVIGSALVTDGGSAART